MTLYAVDTKTGREVPVGSEIVDFRGNRATLVALERVNEVRYGGYCSGKVFARWENRSRSVYDKVFSLEVRDTELEGALERDSAEVKG